MQVTDEMLYRYAPEARDIWLSTRPQKDEVPKYEVSKRFAHKMEKLLRKQRRTPRMNQVMLVMKRTVSVALVALTVSFAGLMTVEAYREKVVEIIVQGFHELTEYRFYTEETEIVIPDVSFGYIPDGMTEMERSVTPGKRSSYRYEDETGRFFELRLRGIKANGSYVQILDTEDAYIGEFTVRGTVAMVIEKDGVSTIQWADGNIVYQLHGEIELSELKEIAKNIKIFEK